MIRAYSEFYLNDAKYSLSQFFDYAVNVCGFQADRMAELFVVSGYAKQFERGNPAVISGMSGAELARAVISKVYQAKEFPESVCSMEKSPEYWAGFVLAEYQWHTCRSFRDIFEYAPMWKIIAMYRLYHEMDISQFIEAMEHMQRENSGETKLKKIRESRGISQSELAELSGVKLRSVQMYEQRGNDIDKAQAHTLYKLALVLGCDIEDLLENPSN